MIRNKKTGQMYIGQSKNIEQRFKLHCSITDIDKAIMLEGKDNFDFIILEEVPKGQLYEREKYWIEYYNTYNDDYHYNMCLSPNNDGLNNRKYFLWNTKICKYKKDKMFQWGREPNPCKCFYFAYNSKVVRIGMFYDFVTCEVINRLIEEAVK